MTRAQILVCDHLAAEFRALLREAEFAELELSILPATCERRRDLQADLEGREAPGTPGLVLGGDCLAGLEAPEGIDLSIEAVRTCFEMIAGASRVRELHAEGHHLLSPGWLASWRERIDEWGFDRSGAREFFAESKTRFLLLDTGVDEGSAANLEAFTDFVGRPAETLPVGLDPLRRYLRRTLDGAA
jgi:hypothetical protein